MSINTEIRNLRKVTGFNPMTRDDWRRPFIQRGLVEARSLLLQRAGAPGHVVASLSHRPLSEWPEAARENVRTVG